MTFRRTLTLAPLLLVSALAAAQGLSAERTEVLESVAKELRTRAYVPGIDLARWDAIVAEGAAKLATAKTDDEFAREMNVCLRKFGTSHFRFITPRQDETRRTQRTIGLGLQGRAEGKAFRIAGVAPTSPAEKAGLKSGDLIVKIDGKPPTRTALQGERGKSVRLLVKGQRERTLIFEPYSLRRPATLTAVDGATAIFRLPTFSNGYDRAEVERCIGEAAKYPSLIIDLRNNGGGAVVSMQHLMSLFMPQGATVGTFVTKPLATSYAKLYPTGAVDPVRIANWSRYAEPWRTRQIRPARRDDGPLYKGSVAVLVNRGSASASEIFASAMHDVVGADVVGTRSAGAVLVSLFRPVGHGFSLQYPTSDYVTVRDRRLEANPIVPTVEDADPNAEVVKATYLLRRARLRKERFGE